MRPTLVSGRAWTTRRKWSSTLVWWARCVQRESCSTEPRAFIPYNHLSFSLYVFQNMYEFVLSYTCLFIVFLIVYLSALHLVFVFQKSFPHLCVQFCSFFVLLCNASLTQSFVISLNSTFIFSGQQRFVIITLVHMQHAATHVIL